MREQAERVSDHAWAPLPGGSIWRGQCVGALVVRAVRRAFGALFTAFVDCARVRAVKHVVTPECRLLFGRACPVALDAPVLTGQRVRAARVLYERPVPVSPATLPLVPFV